MDSYVTSHFGPVLGLVELTGTVIEHKSGCRAERAVIKELGLPSQHLIDRIRAEYDDISVRVYQPPVDTG